MSIGDKPSIRESVNRATIIGAVLLSTLLVVAVFGVAPAVAGGETVDGSAQTLAAAENESTADSTTLQQTPDKEFSGSIGDSTVLSTDAGIVDYPAGDVTVSGTVYQDDTWDGTVSFQGGTKTLNGTEVTLNGGSVSGEYDEDEGFFSLTGTIEIEVVETGETTTFDVVANTDKADENPSFGDGTATVPVYDQGFNIPSTGNATTDDRLGIPPSELPALFSLDGLSLDITEFASVSGTVVDESGDPIEGATVEVGDKSATTDSTGSYSMTGVVTGSQEFSVSADGYQNVERTETVEDGGTTLDATLQTLYDITGQVTDQDGNPIEGATVEVAGETTVETGGNGNYEVSNLTPGEYNLGADANAYDTASETVTFPDDANEENNAEVNFQLAENVADVEVSVTGGSVFAGETIQVTGTVTNVGDEAGRVDAELEIAQSVPASDSVILEPGEELQLSSPFSPSEDRSGDFLARMSANGESARATLSVKEVVQVGDTAETFVATNTGEGYISFDEPDRDTAISEGVLFPEGEIRIEGKADEAGNWESTSVNFPVLTTQSGLDASVSTPQGLFGEVDREGGSLTSSGPLVVTILVGEEPSFRFNIGATTGSSGALSGSADFQGDSASVLLVDNEFTIPDSSGNSLVDSSLGLPLTESGRAWLELGLDIQFGEVEQTTGSVAGTVTDENGDPIEGATVSVGSTEAQTDADGAFTLEGVSTGTQELTVEADGYVSQTVETDVVEGNATDVTVELTEGSAEFDLQVESVSAAPGDSFTATTLVENVGTAAGETTVSFGADGLFDVEETVEVAPGETAEVTADVSTTEDDAGEHTAVASAGDQSAEGTITISADSGPGGGNAVGGFQATNTGEGFISFDVTDGIQTAREEGLAFPEGGIEIEGVLYDDGTWESTDVSFSNLQVQEGLEGSVTVPNGFTGEYDLEEDYLSSEALLQVEIIAQGQSQGTFEFTVNADTDDSNGPASEAGLSGSADFADGEPTGSATLVDNEYVADDTTGSDIVDNALGLPVTEPGRNWLELHLNIEPVEGVGQSTGTVAGTVTDENGDPIEGATVEVGGESATTDGSGAYEISGVSTGTQTVTATAEGYSETTADVQVTDGETTQQDISMAAGSASMDVEISVSGAAPGETVTAEATVTNTGDAEGTEEITFSFGDQTRTEEVTLGPGESTTITTEWTTEEAGEYEVGASAGGETLARQSVSVQEGNGSSEAEGDFVATSTGGFVGFDYDSESAAREDGVTLPEEIQIVGEINEEEGTWESTDTFFPTFQAQGLDVDIAAPNGVTGQIDLEDEYLTQQGVLRVTVAGEATFEYEINATTGESGELAGEASIDQEAEEGTVTLVDNEYVIEDDTDNSVVNSALSLPSPESGTNWYELSFDVSLEGGSIDQSGDGGSEQSDDGPSIIRSFGLVGGALALAGALILIVVIALGRFTGGLNIGSRSD